MKNVRIAFEKVDGITEEMKKGKIRLNIPIAVLI